MAQQNTITGEANTILGIFKALNINSAGSDNAITIPYAKYIVRKVIITNASADLTLGLATIGVFTGAGATGSTIVSAGAIAALSGSTKYLDMTIALTADILTAATLYIRNVLANGSSATVDVYIIGDVLN